jgi:hypothetical protein
VTGITGWLRWREPQEHHENEADNGTGFQPPGSLALRNHVAGFLIEVLDGLREQRTVALRDGTLTGTQILNWDIRGLLAVNSSRHTSNLGEISGRNDRWRSGRAGQDLTIGRVK